MSFAGTSSTGLSKKRLAAANQQQPAIGFQKTVFAHKATAGSTGFNLTSLTVPTEMSANGFTNPLSATLTGAQLLFYRNNLKLWSSVIGDMKDYYHYTVASSGQVTFLNGYTASENEIFIGTIDYNSQTGVQVVSALNPPATGSLAAGTTDFNVGFPFQVGLNSSSQIGAVQVWKNGQLMVRNTGNASAATVLADGATGDYQEVDNGSGLGQIIRFNVADPDNSATIVVLQAGRVAEMPNGSMMALIEALNGQINNMATYVAALAGQSQSTVLGSAPTNSNLQTFGNIVQNLQQLAALTNQANAWSVAQALPSGTTINNIRTDLKQYLVGQSYNNGTPTLTSSVSGFAVERATLIPYQTTDGAWHVRCNAALSSSAGLTMSAVGSITGLFSNQAFGQSMSLSGVTFAPSPATGAPDYNQTGTCFCHNGNWIGTGLCYATPNANTINFIVFASSSTSQSGFSLSFDWELASKPTWAD